MALSNLRILEERKKGNITIIPFRKKLLQTSSYDVRLGEYYYRKQKPVVPGFHNIYNPEHTKRRWDKPIRAQKAKNVFKKLGVSDYAPIKPNDRVIILAPGENILAYTKEFIGGRNTITTSMQAKSSMARNQITVCMCGGWGDIDYDNRWTLELKNHDDEEWVALVVGEAVAQIIFDYAGPIIPGSSYATTGNYQKTSDRAKMISLWELSSMLPRLKIKRIR